MSGSISKQITNKDVLFYFDAANRRSYDGRSNIGYSLVVGTTASLLTGVTWSADRGGKMTFNGTYSQAVAAYTPDSWISGGNRVSTLAPNFPITLEAWINPKSLNGSTTPVGYGIFALDAMEQYPGNYYGVDISLGPNNGTDTHIFNAGYFNGIDFGVAGRRSISSTTRPVICGTWNHVAVVFTGIDAVNIYVNGATVSGTLSGSSTTGIAWSGGTGKTTIGKGAGYYKYLFNGDIAMVRAYNAALSSADIKSNYDLHARRFGKE